GQGGEGKEPKRPNRRHHATPPDEGGGSVHVAVPPGQRRQGSTRGGGGPGEGMRLGRITKSRTIPAMPRARQPQFRRAGRTGEPPGVSPPAVDTRRAGPRGP